MLFSQCWQTYRHESQNVSSGPLSKKCLISNAFLFLFVDVVQNCDAWFASGGPGVFSSSDAEMFARSISSSIGWRGSVGAAKPATSGVEVEVGAVGRCWLDFPRRCRGRACCCDGLVDDDERWRGGIRARKWSDSLLVKNLNGCRTLLCRIHLLYPEIQGFNAWLSPWGIQLE